VVALALVVLGFALRDERAGAIMPGLGSAHVARLNVQGFIGDDRKLLQTLDRLRRDSSVRAVLVAIDSPGGSVAGGEALHDALARMVAVKPVVAVMAGTAASAGYMVALPAQRIFARSSTVTGSIGVILQSFDASGLLEWLGVTPETIASGRFKDQPSPFRALSEEGRAELSRVVQDLHEQFVAMVAAGRRMPPEQVRALADGRVFTGREALALGLVDALGGEAEARAWLAETHAVPAALPARDIEIRGLAERTFGSFIGLLTKSLADEWVGVDRVRALWQPYFR
jgi:protease-4